MSTELVLVKCFQKVISSVEAVFQYRSRDCFLLDAEGLQALRQALEVPSISHMSSSYFVLYCFLYSRRSVPFYMRFSKL